MFLSCLVICEVLCAFKILKEGIRYCSIPTAGCVGLVSTKPTILTSRFLWCSQVCSIPRAPGLPPFRFDGAMVGAGLDAVWTHTHTSHAARHMERCRADSPIIVETHGAQRGEWTRCGQQLAFLWAHRQLECAHSSWYMMVLKEMAYSIYPSLQTTFVSIATVSICCLGSATSRKVMKSP